MAHEEQPLPCLPGASRDPGTGGVSQVLLDALFEDAALLALPAEQAVAAHREHREAWYAGLVGPLLVPVGSVEAVCAAFGPAEDGLRVALLSEPSAGQEAIHRAGDVLREDGRAEVVAVHLPLPAGGDPGSAARQLLDALALSVPARVELRPEPGWEEALAVLAEDGAEEVALRCGPADPGRPGGPGWPPVELARALRSVVDRGLTVRVLGVRTAVGAMALTFYIILTVSCMNDIIALKFHISLNATTWMGRIGLIVLPPLVYFITYRWAISLQRSDRDVLAHGIETGIIRREAVGEYIEIHQPLGPVDSHGHPIPLPYEGAALPKRMNKLGSAGAPGTGTVLVPDSPEEQALNERIAHEQHAAEKKALQELQANDGKAIED